jgi:hypothetical protein
MSSVLKVNEIQHTGGNSAMTINSDGLILPKVPSFEAIKTGSQTLTNATWTKITFQTESYDTGSHFDLANSKLQPTVAGYYHLNALLYYGSGINTAIRSTIYKNGAEHRKIAVLYHTDASLDDYGISGSCMVYANGTTDYFELYGWASGTATVNGDNDGRESIMSGHLVSVA